MSRHDDGSGIRAPWMAGVALFAMVCGGLIAWSGAPAPAPEEPVVPAEDAELAALRAAFNETQQAEVALENGNHGDVRGHLRRAQTRLAELMAARGQTKDRDN